MSENKNENLEVISKLQTAIEELDHNRVAWIFKSQVLDLKNKSIVLLESVSRLEENEKAAAISAAQGFLTEIELVIKMIKIGDYR